MARGTEIHRAAAERIRAEKEQQQLTEHCLWCGWTISGILGETRHMFHQHRVEQHPEVKPRRVRSRRTTTLPKVSDKTLDENIANARHQGASSWAGPL